MVHILQNWGQKYELDAGGRVAANQEELQMWNLVYKTVCVCVWQRSYSTAKRIEVTEILLEKLAELKCLVCFRVSRIL